MSKEDVYSYEEYRALFKLSEEELEEMFPDQCYLMYYPTKGHEENDKRWWSNGKELKMFIKVGNEYNKNLLNALLWRKGK